jgi:cell division septation protein DedD
MNSQPAAPDHAIADNAIADNAIAGEQKNQEPRKRIPLASIPVTISIGLLIAALYLGGRIFTAHRIQKPSPAIHAAPAPLKAEAKPVPPPAQSEAKPAAPPLAALPKPATPATPENLSADDGLPTIQPRSGERYLQVGALDPDAKDTRRFVERLRSEGLDPHVTAGPTPALTRVLIGPFTKLDALNEKKAQIEGEGIDTFVREY